jgi:class 3 adenylate cyclase/tetratricopeptide (TPR) repeat protein
MRCSNCGSENPTGKKFCADCGAPLASRCPQCGAEGSPGKRFCGDCGAALGPESKTIAVPPTDEPFAIPPSDEPSALKGTDPSLVDGERKMVTALFADLKGSTELMESLDPEEARAIVDPALRIMVEAVRRYEGYVVQSTGDGIFALFGAPAAYEDHPQRGLYAALQMQQQIREYARRLVNQRGPELEARFGIDTGEVVVRTLENGGKVEYTPIGHTANLASRLQTLAPRGSIAVSEATRRLVEGYFELRALGQMQVRGVAEPIEIYEVIGPGPLRTHFELSARRGLTRFVGRESEQQQIQHALELAMSGHGQLVAVVAEAGTGKSRLFHEFKVTLPPECKVLEAYSASHGKSSAWLPVIELLRAYFGIQDFDDPAARREKVRMRITALDPAFSEALPYLWGLLGIQEGPDPLAQMDAPIRRQRALEAIKRIIVRESLNQPTVVIFEDLHWIDSETQALLDLVADSIGGVRLLLLVNYRPEYRHEWSGRAHYLQLRLDPLGGENAAAMLEGLLGNGAELDSLKRHVTDRTGGNPFFMEEMVRALFEQGILIQNGSVKQARALSQVYLPVTVQGVLAARIDRLQASDRDLLHMLAVLGREFPLELVQRVATVPADELQHGLSRLQAGEFIYERLAVPVNDVGYVFKHALTQEVAYNSVLIERRKLLHERAAQALEALFVDSIDEHLVDLSHHYSRSGNDSRAIDYLILVAEQAQQRSAYSQATTYLQQALTRTNDQPAGPDRLRREITIHARLADSAMVMSGYAATEYETHLTRWHELAQRLGDTTQMFYSLVGMSVLSAFRLELNRARDIGWKLLNIADHEHDPQMQLQAHGSLANTLWLSGDIIGSCEHAEKGLALFADKQILRAYEEQWRAACKLYACSCKAALGFPDKALGRAFEFLTWAKELGQPPPLAFALNEVATILAWRREGEQALQYADALLVLSAEHGFSNWHSFGQIVRGQALALLGRTDEAIAEIQTALDSLAGTGAPVPGWAYANLALAYLAAERPAEGLGIAAKGLQTPDRNNDPYLYQLHGELLLMSDSANVTDAETSFRAAIAMASKQSAKYAELCATTSLARLLAKRGRRDEARAMLAQIYNWFTEGFGTADLKDAKALLDELSG